MGFTSRPLGTGPSSLIQDEALRKKGVHVGDGVGPQQGEGILGAGVGVWRGGGGGVGGGPGLALRKTLLGHPGQEQGSQFGCGVRLWLIPGFAGWGACGQGTSPLPGGQCCNTLMRASKAWGAFQAPPGRQRRVVRKHSLAPNCPVGINEPVTPPPGELPCPHQATFQELGLL